MLQPGPVVGHARAHLPRQALRRREQVGAGHHALGRHFQAGHRVEQRTAGQQWIHGAQRRAGFAVARRHAIGNRDLRVAGRRVQAVLDQLAVPLHPHRVSVAIRQIQQAVGLPAGGGVAVEHLGAAIVARQQPTAVFQLFEQQAGFQHARKTARRHMDMMLVEQRQHLARVGEALGIPLEHRLVGLEAPGRRQGQRHGIQRNLLIAQARHQGRRLGRHLAVGLLQPCAHRPQHRLAGAAGQRGVLVEDLGRLADEQEQVQHRVVDGEHIGALGGLQAHRVLDAPHRVGVHAPAARAPGQRQGAMLGVIGHHGFAAAVEISRRFAQAIDGLGALQAQAHGPHGLVGFVERVVAERGRMRGHFGSKDFLVAAIQFHAHGIGEHLKRGIALGDTPAAAVVARRQRRLAHGLLARQQHFSHGARTRAGFFIGEETRLATTQAVYARRVRFDYQVQAVARVEVDAARAGRQQLDGVELGSMSKVELRRHRASPGFSQKTIKRRYFDGFGP
ncbi:Uncharacterised protein [Bordetella pertussis]|nr:Uncharacterised protein [Bordetella pertussis]